MKRYDIIEHDYGDWVKYGDIYPYLTAYKDLLDEAMNLYEANPNNFRRPAKEYFKEEIDFLEGLE